MLAKMVSKNYKIFNSYHTQGVNAVEVTQRFLLDNINFIKATWILDYVWLDTVIIEISYRLLYEKALEYCNF